MAVLVGIQKQAVERHGPTAAIHSIPACSVVVLIDVEVGQTETVRARTTVCRWRFGTGAVMHAPRRGCLSAAVGSAGTGFSRAGPGASTLRKSPTNLPCPRGISAGARNPLRHRRKLCPDFRPALVVTGSTAPSPCLGWSASCDPAARARACVSGDPVPGRLLISLAAFSDVMHR